MVTFLDAYYAVIDNSGTLLNIFRLLKEIKIVDSYKSYLNNITGHNAEPCRLCSTMADTILYWKQSYSLFINLALYLTVKTSKIDFLIVILHHVGLTGKGVVKNTKCITTNESLAIKINSKHESHQKSLALGW